MQKYPQDRRRYRSRISNCCRSRTGQVKAAWKTEAQALEAGVKYSTAFEAYECTRGRGWHLRAKREEERG